jgi:hypothetical protein
MPTQTVLELAKKLSAAVVPTQEASQEKSTSSPYSFELVGTTHEDKPARIGSEVAYFFNSQRQVLVFHSDDGRLQVVTRKGRYFLQKHASQNIYLGKCGGHKVHVSLKKVVGEMRYW